MPVWGGPAEGLEDAVYVVTYEDPAGDQGRLFAVERRGTVKWQRSLTQVSGNPPVLGVDGAVHVVGQHVWVFNADGSLRWSLTERPPSLPSFYSAAVSADGVLLAAMGFDLFAFAASDGDTLWQGPGTSDASWIVPATFSADGRTVFIKRSTDSGYARVSATGALRWQVPDPLAGRLGFAGPAVGDGRVYFAGAYQLLATDTLGGILGVSPDRGCCVSEPAIGPDGTLYVQVGGNAQGVWAFNPFYTVQWGFPGVRPSRGWYGGPALAAGGVLYAAAFDGFYALQLSPSGAAVRWRFPADTSQRLKFYGAPLIGRDGTVYSFTSTVGGTDTVDATDELFAFWEDKPAEPDSPWPMWRHDARRSGQAHR
jgi:outer membrane protein assembly factor BamB